MTNDATPPSEVSAPKPRRGLADRPTSPSHLEDEIARQFDLVTTGPMVELGGSSTLNLRLQTTEAVYVVRLYRSWMRPARLRAIQAARHHLAEVGIPCPLPILTRDGNSWTEVDGHLMEIEPYISFDSKMDTWERLEQGLPLLGRLHDRLLTLDVPQVGRIAPAANSIDREHVVEGVRQGATRLRDIYISDDELKLADLSEMLAEQVASAERSLDTGPRQLVHGDYWDNNVYFRDGGIVLVADLDFMGARPRIDDLALTLYYTNSTFADDQVSPERVARLGSLVRAYDAGVARALSETERLAIPLAMARTAIGFIAQMTDTDSEEAIHSLAQELMPDLRWVRTLLNVLEEWQEVLQKA
jgi:Ser/Thr protein kinase RdoA (MazF antagonist)